ATVRLCRRANDQQIDVELGSAPKTLNDLAHVLLRDFQLDLPAPGLIPDAQERFGWPHLAVGKLLAELPVQDSAAERRPQPEETWPGFGMDSFAQGAQLSRLEIAEGFFLLLVRGQAPPLGFGGGAWQLLSQGIGIQLRRSNVLIELNKLGLELDIVHQ